MPNWVQNTVKVTENIEEFKKAVLNEEGHFDFNKIIPMAKELEITSSSGSYKNISPVCSYSEGSYGYETYQIIKNLEPTLEEYYTDTISQEDFVNEVVGNTLDNPYFKWYGVSNTSDMDIPLKAKGYWNYKRFGYTDWYEWAYANWGTKWNACDSIVSEGEVLYIEFQTAWATPDNIWEELKNRGFNFSVIYADEDYGSNLGVIVVKDKEFIINNFDESYNLNERRFLSDLIFCGLESENIDDEDYEFEPISLERRVELEKLVEPFLV